MGRMAAVLSKDLSAGIFRHFVETMKSGDDDIVTDVKRFIVSEKNQSNTDAQPEKEASKSLTNITLSSPRRKKLHTSVPVFQEQPFKTIASWYGEIESVTSDVFVAKIAPTDSSEGHTGKQFQFAEFQIEEIEPKDRDMIKAGALFRWHVGHKRNKGQLTNSEIFVFRTFPAWTDKYIEKVQAKANETFDYLFGDHN